MVADVDRDGSPTRLGRRRLVQPSGWLLSLVVGTAAALVSWFRLSPAVRGSLWAEDGALFLQQWVNDSLLHVFTPYDGYLHVVPRLVVGGAASLAPPEGVALAISACCCAVVGVLAGVVHASTVDLVDSAALRVLLAMVTALGPGAAQEVLGNTANLHWYFLWATPWILLHRPRTRLGAAGAAALVLAASLSEIQVALFVALLPFAVRTVRSLPAAGALLLGVATQVAVLVQHPRPARAGSRPSVQDVVEGFLAHPVLGTLTGRWSVQGEVVNAVSWWAPAAVAALVLAAVVGAVVCGGARRRVAALALTGAAGAVYSAGVLLNPNDLFRYASFGHEQWGAAVAPRYAVVPTMFLLAAAVVGLDAVLASGGRVARLASRGAASVVVLVLVANAVPGPATRASSPGWAEAVAGGLRECRSGVDAVQLPISPSPSSVVVSCTRLAGWTVSGPTGPDEAPVPALGQLTRNRC